MLNCLNMLIGWDVDTLSLPMDGFIVKTTKSVVASLISRNRKTDHNGRFRYWLPEDFPPDVVVCMVEGSATRQTFGSSPPSTFLSVFCCFQPVNGNKGITNIV
jgi:hypothetical protein